MPRIRKKTSKRGTTRHRERIKHKVSEHYKKTKKRARKDKAAGKLVQKKSKKDPGIPNNFPYKDQILAEVVEQRRQVAAEKQRRKDEKRAAAAGTDLEKSPTPEDDEQGFDGITSLKPASVPKNKVSDNAVHERTPAIPVFPGPTTLRAVMQKAHVVLHVVDARDPAASMSNALVEAAQGKLVLLLNKADTVPRESLAQWLAYLRTSYTVFAFRASSAFMPSGTPFETPNKKAKPMSRDDALGLAALWTYLDGLARAKNHPELVVAVTGVTNAGKSAVINSILRSDALAIYNTHMAASAKGHSTSTSALEVVATIPGDDARKVRFIDTPGLQFARAASMTDQETDAMRARDVLLRCRGRIDRLKDPLFGVTHIITHADTQDLMLAYGLPAFLRGDVTGCLAGLARVNGLIKKRGAPDHAGAARIVLRDWSTGKLMRYSMPESGGGETTDGDATVLEAVKSRKELRSAVGVKLVKMEAGVSDKRDIEWDVVWGADEEQDEGSEEEQEEQEEQVSEEEETDGDGDRPARRVGKRRVSFAVETGKRRRR